MPAATKEEAYTAKGVPAEWVAPLQKAGILTVDALASAVPGKLHQELCGINKKFKLGEEPFHRRGDILDWRSGRRKRIETYYVIKRFPGTDCCDGWWQLGNCFG